ncbi:hypothetical protein ACIGPN_16880 [Streptomyces afghaniensis]|uniref:hypothetical protein n=1 Tax=Streptomyces afghaniensis TaxID=66865 RepID=UPI0037D8B442
MSSTETETTPEAQVLALLELPSIGDLTEDQVRGFTCVWDGSEAPLTDEAAVDLGPRRMRRLDGEYEWHPRGCRQHVEEAAFLKLFDHCQEECEPCGRRCENGVNLDSHCDTGRALTRLSLRRW